MTARQAHQSSMALGSLWPLSLPLAGLLLCLILVGTWLDTQRQQQRLADSLSKLLVLREQADHLSPVQYLIQAQRLSPVLRQLGGDAGLQFQERVEQAVERLTQGGAPRRVSAEQLQAIHAVEASAVSVLRDSVAAGERSAAQLYGLLIATLLAAFAGTVLSMRRTVTAPGEKPWPAGNVDAQLFENSPVPIVYSDHRDTILAANAAYLRMSGYLEEETVGQPLFFNEAGRQDEAFFVGMRERLADDGRWQGELWMRNKKGEAYSNKVVRLAVCDGGDRVAGYLTVSAESLQADEQQKLMLWQAHHDPLTKLPNKIMLEERMSRALLHEKPSGILITLDLDRFKEVNDSIGPSLGDQVLMDAAMRLAMCADEDDTVSRMGGDVFAIVSSDGAPQQRAERLTSAIQEALIKPFRLENREIFIQASVGVVCFPKDGEHVPELLQKADAARSEVKRRGGNGIGYFEPEINQRAERRLTLQTALRNAINEDQLSLALQPIVALSERNLLGAEALLRWQHPELGMVSPAEFIPVAESSGLIMDIGLWVVEEAQKVLKSWGSNGYGHLRLSLNVSALQIQHIDDCQLLLDGLRKTDTNRLTLEITESAIIDNSETAKYFLERAVALGCQVALDDFGTGFSSLAYLREFQFDVLKVDKVFIDSLDSPRDLGLVASIISMGKILGMRVVAEGVEEDAQLQQLTRIGCHFAQGYLFSKPLPFAEFLAYAQGEANKETA